MSSCLVFGPGLPLGPQILLFGPGLQSLLVVLGLGSFPVGGPGPGTLLAGLGLDILLAGPGLGLRVDFLVTRAALLLRITDLLVSSFYYRSVALLLPFF